MTRRRAAGVGITLVSVCLAAAVGYLLMCYDTPPLDPSWAVAGDVDIPDGAVTVRFTGTSTLLFSDGITSWMTDAWFTRVSPLRLLVGKIEPDLEAIEAGLQHNQADRLAAVFVLHSHFDHAMDAPEVARRTGALLLGSESTANIARGWGLPEAQIRVVREGQAIILGDFTLTPILSRHFQFPDAAMVERALENPDIRKPLVPPVKAFDYRLGEVYQLHVSHPRGSWLIVGSAGFLAGALAAYDADLVFLGVGGLGSQSDEYRQQYWRESVARVQPSRVIPIHWDSLTGPIEGPLRGPVKAAALLSGGGAATRAFLKQKQAQNPQLQFVSLPRYDPVILFQGESE